LLSVSLSAPYSLTQSQTQVDKPGLNTLAMELPVQPGQSAVQPYLPLVAQSKFMRPQSPANTLTIQNMGAPTPQLDNRWYRILELLEVPSSQNMVVENFLQAQFPWLSTTALQRVAARINLNTLRHAENLYALLDDPNQFNIFGYNSPAANLDGSYNDLYE